MAEYKNNFIFYTDYYETLSLLTYEQKGRLLDALCLFQMGKDVPDLDSITSMAFMFISADMRRNNEKYDAISQKRRVAGSKGGKISQANQANASFASENQANQANASDKDNVNDNVKDNVNDNDNVYVKDKEQNPGSHNTPSRPNPNDVLIEANNSGYLMTVADVANFMAYNDANNWKLEWRYALKRWIENGNQRSKKPKIKTAPSEQHIYDMDELRKKAKA